MAFDSGFNFLILVMYLVRISRMNLPQYDLFWNKMVLKQITIENRRHSNFIVKCTLIE
jgi:hypothetical protein